MWRLQLRRDSTRLDANKKPPDFRRAVSFWFDPYSPLPKRRDHQPALRGAASSDAAGAGSAGAGVTSSGVLWVTEGDAGSACGLGRCRSRDYADANRTSCKCCNELPHGAPYFGLKLQYHTRRVGSRCVFVRGSTISGES